MDYPISVPGVGLVGGKFTDGNPLLSQPASLDPASWANAVTDELLNVIRAAAIVPAEAVTTQLLAAITALARGVLPKRSFAANDYIRIPDVPGGLIIQWGLTAGAAQNVPVTVTLPITFPAACRCIQLTYLDGAVSQPATRGAPSQVGVFGISSFQYSHAGSASGAQHMWFAIGN